MRRPSPFRLAAPLALAAALLAGCDDPPSAPPAPDPLVGFWSGNGEPFTLQRGNTAHTVRVVEDWTFRDDGTYVFARYLVAEPGKVFFGWLAETEGTYEHKSGVLTTTALRGAFFTLDDPLMGDVIPRPFPAPMVTRLSASFSGDRLALAFRCPPGESCQPLLPLRRNDYYQQQSGASSERR
jgi:hypothetical protein